MRSLAFLSLALAAITAACASSPAASRPNEDAVPSAGAASGRAGVIAQEHRWVAAIAARDSAALDSILADDFIDVSWRGTLRRKADMLAALRSGQTHANQISDVDVAIYGRSAIARGINTATGPNGETGRLRFTDVFVYRDGRWIAVSAQETLVAS